MRVMILKRMVFTVQPQTPPPFRSNPALKSRFRGRFLVVFARFRSFSANFGQKQPKLTRNRLLLKGLLRVLDGAGEGVCGWKSGHNSSKRNWSFSREKTKMDVLKCSCPYFSRVFCPEDGFGKYPCLRFTKLSIFY